MTLTTKYNIGQLLAWRIGGKALIVTSIRIYSDSHVEYACTYADADGNPKEDVFKECELEPWNNKPIGFTRQEQYKNIPGLKL